MPALDKTKCRRPLTDRAHLQAPCLSTSSQAEPCVPGCCRLKFSNSPLATCSFWKGDLGQKKEQNPKKKNSLPSGSGIIKLRGQHQSALSVIWGASALRHQIQHSRFGHSACFENTDLFQRDSCIREELEHNANFASVYAQFQLGETRRERTKHTRHVPPTSTRSHAQWRVQIS